LSSGKQFSPGANDNGSGVAVLMAAAETLARDPLEHVQVNFIFFSAEENGLLGSKQYVKEFRSELDGATVLNLDMVGSGERISFVTGAGLLTPRRTSRRLNKQLTHLKPGIRGRWYWMGNSDFYSFLSKRIAAASLEASGKGRENVYHTEKDTMDYVEPQLLGEAFDLVLAFARAVDRAEDDA
jgi:aminopeptidase YwaD